jgi:D-proline reductase (dithiol) PrdB
MDILENKAQWLAEFRNGWLAHFNQTGETKWDIYNRPKNSVAPAGPGINLAESRLVLITSAGSYLTESQEPFNAVDPLGDYTIRTYPASTDFEDLSYAHDHYNHVAVEEDPQVLIPLRHLEDLVAEGRIGELAPDVISFHGYMPNSARFVDETIPMILEEVEKQQPDAALLIPA